jgi:hypothetical protein
LLVALGLILLVLVIIAVKLHKRPAQGVPNNPAPADQDVVPREQIARLVITISGAGLVLVSIVVIAVALTKGTEPEKTSTMVFNALLPLLGTWVGAVIAYYFSSSNYQAASQVTKDLVQQLNPIEKLASVQVTRAMVPLHKMKTIPLPVAANAAQAAIDGATGNVNMQTAVFALLVDPVTRIPVLDQNNLAMYIIHESVLYKYSAVAPAAPAPADRTLRDFLSQQGMRDLVTNTKAFVAQGGTLADAKAAMEKVADCQDVFVTQTGQATEPVLGWLTNVDILYYSKT